MSGLFMSEFEDTLWDEFFRVDDHEVPIHSFKRSNEHFLRGDSYGKIQHEVTSISSDSEYGSVSGFINQGREQDGYSNMCNQQSMMLGKGSQSHKQSGTISSSDSDDFIEETSGVAFDSTRSSDYGFKRSKTNSKGSEFSMNDVYLDGGTPVDNKSFNQCPGDVNPTENSLDFFENIDSTDRFYDDWPVIGNFEDVDSMFRSSDSTFGIGVGKEDELDFLSSGDDKRECGGLMKSGFKFPCTDSKAAENIPANSDSSKTYLVNGSPLTSAQSGFNVSSAMGFDKADDGEVGFIPRHKEVGLNDTVQPRISSNGRSKANSDVVVDDNKKQFIKLNQSDDISLKAASFWQLQLVMEWLDLKTKLRIRDGLYRLAQGAEHRNGHAKLSGKLGCENISDGSYEAKGTNKCTNFVNMETCTNPIDRTIVHLLFHRPSDSPAIPTHDS